VLGRPYHALPFKSSGPLLTSSSIFMCSRSGSFLLTNARSTRSMAVLGPFLPFFCTVGVGFMFFSATCQRKPLFFACLTLIVTNCRTLRERFTVLRLQILRAHFPPFFNLPNRLKRSATYTDFLSGRPYSKRPSILLSQELESSQLVSTVERPNFWPLVNVKVRRVCKDVPHLVFLEVGTSYHLSLGHDSRRGAGATVRLILS